MYADSSGVLSGLGRSLSPIKADVSCLSADKEVFAAYEFGSD